MTDSEDFDSDNTDSEDVDSEDVDCVPDCPSDPAQEWRDYEEQAQKGRKLCGPGSRKPRYKGPRSTWQWWRRLYRCSACTKFKPRKAFGGKYWGPRPYSCLKCRRAQQAAYKRSPRGRVLRLFMNAQKRSKEREMPYQLPDPKKPTQVFAFFFGLVRRQGYKCTISGARLPPALASLERHDERRGYTPNNVSVIHRDFQSASRDGAEDGQSSSQWTAEKYREVALLRARLRLFGSTFTPKYTLWATAAGPLENQLLTDEQQTLRVRLFTAIASAKTSTEKRREKGRDHEDVEIDVAYLVELYRRQHGRCAYTRVPLAVKGKYKWSLERKENDKGYTKSNTVLVIMEVNHGCAKWSKKKADRYWGGPVPI